MKNTEAFTLIYNGLLQGYQFKQFDMVENQLPDSSSYFRSEKMRESLTNHISALSQIAYDLGDHDLAANFMRTASELGTDAIPPMPL